MSDSAAADILAIQHLILAFARAADAGPLEEYGAAIAEDATWASAGAATVHGREAIVSAARARSEQGVSGPGSNTCHIVTNVIVDVDGDTASSHASYEFFDLSGEVPALRVIGTYRDTFVRTAEGWKFGSRENRPGPPRN